MATEPQELTLPNAVELLQITAPPARVLSVYLATTPDRVRGQGHVLAYRSACASVRSTLPEAEIGAFDACATRVQRYLADDFSSSGSGLAVFASPDNPEYFFLVQLPGPPTDHVVWDIRPHVEVLVVALDEYQRVGVVLFDKERARLFTVYLGEVEEKDEFEDEVPGKQATGGWFALAQTRYARHHEDHVRRHVERTVFALSNLLRRRPFDRLMLAGPDEGLAMLQRQLPRNLRGKVVGTLGLELFASEAEIVRAVHVAAEAIERQEEINAVNELLDAAVTSRHVVLGLGDTVEALNDGRVYVLFVAEAFAGTGRECPNCGRLVPGDDPCPLCGTLATGADGYREALIRHALAQRARVEAVSGEAAARLFDHGGIGAWTHY
jgi:peptide subunit release factor 1 (eRF1)